MLDQTPFTTAEPAPKAPATPTLPPRVWPIGSPVGALTVIWQRASRNGEARFIRSLLSVIGFTLFWQLASNTGVFGIFPVDAMNLFLPSPLTVARTFKELFTQSQYLSHILTSLYRVMFGFSLAAVIGVTAGVLIVSSKVAEDILQPFIRLLQPIPGVAWVPLAIVWFGLGDRAAIFIITVGALWPTLLATIQGLREVDHNLVNAALTLGATRRQIFEKVTVPSIVPHLVTGFRLSMGFGWRAVLAAEMVGVSSGLGYMLTLGRGVGRTDITLATMVSIGCIMLITDAFIFGTLDRKTSNWRPKREERRKANDEIAN